MTWYNNVIMYQKAKVQTNDFTECITTGKVLYNRYASFQVTDHTRQYYTKKTTQCDGRKQRMNIEKTWASWNDAHLFSGVFSVANEQGILFEKCCGFRNKSEDLPNDRNTAFGIASGTKLFTGLAICKLIDAGKLSLDDKLWDIVPFDLGQINKQISIHHLLTHTSGIGDYIDEENPNAVEQMLALYKQYPVYLWERLEYYLPMITPLPQKFEPGVRFGYSNAGFVLLGLVVEAITGIPYQQFVSEEMIRPLNLLHTGFYRMDALPANTALGYTESAMPGQWQTNAFCMPIVGGSDGGLYTCAQDLSILWRAVFACCLFSEKTLQPFLKKQVVRSEKKSYGLGVYRYDNGTDTAYYALGGDFGVDFFTAYFPQKGIVASALGNTEINTFPLLDALFSVILT